MIKASWYQFVAAITTLQYNSLARGKSTAFNIATGAHWFWKCFMMCTNINDTPSWNTVLVLWTGKPAFKQTRNMNNLLSWWHKMIIRVSWATCIQHIFLLHQIKMYWYISVYIINIIWLVWNMGSFLHTRIGPSPFQMAAVSSNLLKFLEH